MSPPGLRAGFVTTARSLSCVAVLHARAAANRNAGTVWLGALSVSGLTAYVGLLHYGVAKLGEMLLVTAASGAVGSIVGQSGRIWGCRVVGVAGGEAKCGHVTGALRFDACVNRRAGDLGAVAKRSAQRYQALTF
jgi:NADPH-dependent curcumin reductase CurA